MNNFGKLLKFEFKKLKNRSIFKIIILCAIILPIVTSFSEYSTIKKDDTIIEKYKSYTAVNTLIENDFTGPSVFIIFSLSIVVICEEFSRGTIKQLFIKPFKKDYHFLSKYIVVCCTVLLFSIIFVGVSSIIFELLYNFQNLNIPNEHLNQDIIYSIPKFMFLNLLSLIPQFLFYIVLIFVWGALTTNPIVSIIYSFGFFMFDNIIAVLLINNETIPNFILNFNISACCSNINNYIFNEELIEGANLQINIIMFLLYLVIFLSLGRKFFKNKEIHNI